MLLGVFDNNLLRTFEETEFSKPVARKPISSTRTIYLSRLMRPKEGPMLLSDFGEARIGPGPHEGDIMPLEYRAPETLLYVGWSYPVDIWSVGLTVSLNFISYTIICLRGKTWSRPGIFLNQRCFSQRVMKMEIFTTLPISLN